MKPNKTFLIIGVRSATNIGIMAIVSSTIRQLEKKYNGNYYILSLTKDVDKELYSRSLPNKKIKLLGLNTNKTIPYSFRVLIHILIGIVGFIKSNIVLDLSGEAPTSSFLPRALEFSLARLFRKPIVIFSQTFYYSEKKRKRFIEKIVLNRASLLIAREIWSYNYLISELNLKNKTYLASDPAFLLPYYNSTKLYEIFLKEDIPKDKIYIGIAPTTLTFQRTPKIKKILLKIIKDFLSTDNKIHIILIPHAIGPVSDDRESIYDLLRNIKHNRVHGLLSLYTPEEVKTVLSNCEILISMRMHAAIGAISTLVPTLLIGDAHKVNLIQRFGLSDFIFSEKKLNEKSFIKAVKALYDNRQKIRLEMKKSVMKSKSESFHAFNLLNKFIQKIDM